MLKRHLFFNVIPLLKFSSCNFIACFDNISFFQQLRKNKREVIVDASHPNGIGILAMNCQRKNNSFSKCFVKELSDALGALKNDRNIRALIVCSLVQDTFSAGEDQYELTECTDSEALAVIGKIRSLCNRLYHLPMPTITAIDGSALGSGLQLALACDLRYAGVLPVTRIGLIESNWSLLLGAGGSQYLARLIGSSRAKELMFCARRMSAEEAAAYGVVNAAVSPDECNEAWKSTPALCRAIEIATEISLQGPLAVRQIKRAVDEGLSARNLEEGLMIESECYARVVCSKDHREGMRAFAEKRQPIFTGD